MHGQILVDSEEDEGTHFTVNLPLPVHDEQESRPSIPAIPDQLRQLGVDMGMPQEYPHRGPIEHQLRAWSIPLREAAPGGEGILMIVADESDKTAGQLASAWPGTGIILVDRDSTTQPSEDRQILSMPLRREQLFRALCRAAGLEQDATGSMAAAVGTPASASRALNLLLVEDNQVNQVVASGMLKKLGHTVTLAENGRQALDALQQSREIGRASCRERV